MPHEFKACDHGWPVGWKQNCPDCLAELAVLIELREERHQALERAAAPYADDEEVGPEVTAAYQLWAASDEAVNEWYAEARQ